MNSNSDNEDGNNSVKELHPVPPEGDEEHGGAEPPPPPAAAAPA